MQSVDELLTLAEQKIEEKEYCTVNDEIVVNPITRMIDVPISERLFGVVEDANVEKKYFRCHRYVGDDIDLSKLKIYMKYVHAIGNTPEEWEDTIPQFTWCDDVKVDGNDIVWTWKLSENVFTKKGFVAFAMVAKDENTVAFNTYPAIGTVLTTIPYGSEEISMMYPDIVTQLLMRMDSVEAIATPEAMQNYIKEYFEENPITPTDEQVVTGINDWLVAHPESTTTVQDGSITENKLHTELLDKLNNSYNAISLQKQVNKHSKLYFSEQALVYGDYTNTVNKCVDAGITNAHIYVALNYDEESGTLISDNEISNLDQYYAFCKSKGIVQDVLKIHTNESTKKILSENETLRAKYINKVNELIDHFNVDKNLKIVYVLNESEVITVKTQFDDFVKSVIDAIHAKSLKAGISFAGETNAYYFTRNLPFSYADIDIIGINAYPAIHSGEYASIQDSINVWNGYMLYMEKIKRDGKLLAITETGLCPAWRNLRVPYHWENPMLSGNKIDEFVPQLYLYGLFNNNRINTMCDSICLWFVEYIPYMNSVIKFIKSTYIGG